MGIIAGRTGSTVSKARQIFDLAFRFGKNCQIKNLATCVPEIFVHLIPKPRHSRSRYGQLDEETLITKAIDLIETKMLDKCFNKQLLKMVGINAETATKN